MISELKSLRQQDSLEFEAIAAHNVRPCLKNNFDKCNSVDEPKNKQNRLFHTVQAHIYCIRSRIRYKRPAVRYQLTDLSSDLLKALPVLRICRE